MVQRLASLTALLAFTLFLLSGCGTSQQSAQAPGTQPPPQEQPARAAEKPADRVDTVSVSSQANTKPDYSPSAGASAFTVQAGAYKQQESAERVASLARERFAKSVSVQFDNTGGLYKVMIGNFPSKDEARRFRDQIVSQYPTDYKDAWVSELNQK